MNSRGHEKAGSCWLGQILAHLNSYNRATKMGRQAAVNLCRYPQAGRITINEGEVRVKEGT